MTKQEALRFKISERILRDWRAKIKNRTLNLKKKMKEKILSFPS